MGHVSFKIVLQCAKPLGDYSLCQIYFCENKLGNLPCPPLNKCCCQNFDLVQLIRCTILKINVNEMSTESKEKK